MLIVKFRIDYHNLGTVSTGMQEKRESREDHADLRITGGVVLPMTPDFRVLDPGELLIRNGLILALGRCGEFAHISARRTIDAGGKLVMPGLVNTHTHAAMSCFRGLADDVPLHVWLGEYVFPLESRFLTPEVVYRSTLLSCAEMLLSGTTTFADGYFFEEEVVRAAMMSGMRVVAAQGVIDFPAPGVPDPARNVEHASAVVHGYNHASGRVRGAVFAHSAYTCSPATLEHAKQAAREAGVLFFIHVAETRWEVQQIRERYNRTPIGHLAHLGVLDDQTVAVHCVWVTPEDVDLMKETGVRVSCAVESEMKLASGIPPIPDMIRAGLTVSIGTDGPASNNDLDMFSEMSTTAKLFKAQTLNPESMPARRVVWMATREGAAILNLEEEIGSLEPGKRADMILIDLDKPHLVPVYDYYSHLAYSVKGSDVDTVIVDGAVLVEGGRLIHLDTREIMGIVRGYAEEIRGRVRGGPVPSC